jgi:hypothetical protein
MNSPIKQTFSQTFSIQLETKKSSLFKLSKNYFASIEMMQSISFFVNNDLHGGYVQFMDDPFIGIYFRKIELLNPIARKELMSKHFDILTETCKLYSVADDDELFVKMLSFKYALERLIIFTPSH